MGLKFFIESSVGGDCVVSGKRDIKVFIEGGDVEGKVCNFRRIMDWRVWILFVLEGLAEPHSSVP